MPSNPAITQRQLIQLVAAEIQKPVKTSLATPLMVGILGVFNPNLREMVEMLYQCTQPFEMDSHKLTQTFGMKPTPHKQQIQETIAWVLAQDKTRQAILYLLSVRSQKTLESF